MDRSPMTVNLEGDTAARLRHYAASYGLSPMEAIKDLLDGINYDPAKEDKAKDAKEGKGPKRTK